MRRLLIIFPLILAIPGQFVSAQSSAHKSAYLGFDRNLYPGDGAMVELRKTFSFTGYWLSPPPGTTTITTADDIHTQIPHFIFWVFNDSCPPSPGCDSHRRPPSPSHSGVGYAKIWQFAQSPRRAEFTSGCAATYQPDGNCYSPTDGAKKWFLDLDSASSPDPSAP
ncbi:MAG TPA: hypothetical protein VN982_07340 [Candidatus Dormibacteraeota bacterium]|nr:hypothetical protein [Candidatus Dormibacteraeota bacterium]